MCRILWCPLRMGESIVFSIRTSSTAWDATRKPVAISFSLSNGGRFSSSRPLMVLTMRRTRSVDNLSGLDSKAYVGQWVN